MSKKADSVVERSRNDIDYQTNVTSTSLTSTSPTSTSPTSTSPTSTSHFDFAQ
jgi:hypothetical protein